MNTSFIKKAVKWSELEKIALIKEGDARIYEIVTDKNADRFAPDLSSKMKDVRKKQYPVPEGCICIVRWKRVWDSDLQKNLDVSESYYEESIIPKCLIAPIVKTLRTIPLEVFYSYKTYGEWQRKIECGEWEVLLDNMANGCFDNPRGYNLDLFIEGKIPQKEKEAFIKEDGESYSEYDYEERFNRWTFRIGPHYCEGDMSVDVCKKQFEKFFEPYLRAFEMYLPEEEKKDLPESWCGYTPIDKFFKEFEYEKIQLYVDDINNIHDLKIIDLNDNETYTFRDLIGSRTKIKNFRIETDSCIKEKHNLILYSENGIEYKLDLFNFRREITAKKVETNLDELYDEFLRNSDWHHLGENLRTDEEELTIACSEYYDWWYFKKGSDGRFYFRSDPRKPENSADNFETAIIKYFNEKEQTALYDIRMEIENGDRLDSEPRKSLNRDRQDN